MKLVLEIKVASIEVLIRLVSPFQDAVSLIAFIEFAFILMRRACLFALALEFIVIKVANILETV